MARSRSRSGRDTSAIASRQAAPLRRSAGVTLGLPSLTAALSLLALLQEDRRQWHPQGPARPARATVRSAARLVPAPRKDRYGGVRSWMSSLPSAVSFAAPRRVAVCVRRHRRREVLHALGVAGGSGGRFKRRRRSEYSSISCR